MHLWRLISTCSLIAFFCFGCGDSQDGGGSMHNSRPDASSGDGSGGASGTGGEAGLDSEANDGSVDGSAAGEGDVAVDMAVDVAVDAGGPDGTVPEGGIDLCAPPAGNLFAHGTFEEGMSGEAPVGWEVRNPAQPGNCAGSGTPAEHLFLTAAPPGCGGNALAIDGRGEWDCYAIQRVSDYNSIEGGATYRISAVVRSEGNAANPAAWFTLGIQWLDGSDAFFDDVKNPKPNDPADNDYDWKVMSFDIVAPANARRILVWLSAHYPGRVDYDNVSVVKL